MTTPNLRGCLGKHRFKNELLAGKEVKRMILQNGADVFRMNAYPCEVCGFFHVGNRGNELLAKVAPTVVKKGKKL